MKKLKLFFSTFLLMFVLAFAGCQSTDEASLDNKEIFEEDLKPVSEDELAQLEAGATDEEMTPLDEDELALLEGTNQENSAEKPGDASGNASDKGNASDTNDSGAVKVEEDGTYTSTEEVAVYLHTFDKLPSNYITKKEAQNLGWVSKEGNLDEVAPGKSIGGDKFGNYEGMLPKEDGRKYFECDIDFDGSYRNAKRIIYSNDGLIFYTEDHYKTFEQLY